MAANQLARPIKDEKKPKRNRYRITVSFSPEKTGKKVIAVYSTLISVFLSARQRQKKETLNPSPMPLHGCGLKEAEMIKALRVRSCTLLSFLTVS